MNSEQIFYRGGSQFIAKLNEVKIDQNTGFVKPTNGISVHLDPNKVRRFRGAYKIIYLPDTLITIGLTILSHFFVCSWASARIYQGLKPNYEP